MRQICRAQCPDSGAVLTTTAMLALLTNAQIERESSNNNRAASGYETFEGMEGGATNLRSKRFLIEGPEII